MIVRVRGGYFEAVYQFGDHICLWSKLDGDENMRRMSRRCKRSFDPACDQRALRPFGNPGDKDFFISTVSGASIPRVFVKEVFLCATYYVTFARSIADLMKIKIGIMGSADDALDSVIANELRERAEDLGRALAARGCIVLTGATTGLPHTVGATAHRAGALHVGISPAENAQEHFARYRLPLED